ncbi:cytochrome P450 [Cryomyces antarcticus]
MYLLYPESPIKIILAAALITIVRKALFSQLRHLPGPFYTSWTNLWLKLQVLRGRRIQYIHGLHQRYGHYVRISPSEVSVSDLDGFRTIHRIGSGFNKSEWYQRFNKSPHPGVFAMTDPKQHATRRRLFAQSFSKSSILTFEMVVRQRIDLAVAKIKRDAEQGSADILKWFTFMATDVSAVLALHYITLHEGRCKCNVANVG